jgi:hypothetical protein
VKILPLLCAALSISLVEAKDLKVFLLTGQSNSLGAIKGSPASAEDLEKYKPKRVMYWHENFAQNGGVFPGASTSWGDVEPAVPEYNGSLCMGPEYGFAWTLEKHDWFKDDDVAIIKASRDGGGNSNWQKGGQGYTILCGAVEHAMAALDKSKYGKIEFAGLIYLQGESNNADESGVADKRFLELLNNLSQDLKSYGDTKLLAKQVAVIGENANWGSKNETDPETGTITGGLEGKDTESPQGTTCDIMRRLAEKNPSLGYAPTRDLPKLTSGDTMGVHYDGRSQISIGSRVAYAFARLNKLDVGAVRSGRYDLALDAPEAWMEGKVPDKKAWTWDLASSIKPSVLSDKGGVAKASGIEIKDVDAEAISITNGGNAKSALVIGPKGIKVKSGKKLFLKTSVNLAGKQQEWTLGDNAEVILGDDSTELTGDAAIKIKHKGDSSSPARVVVKSSAGKKPFAGSLTVGEGVEVVAESDALATAKVTVAKGGTLSLNGHKKPSGLTNQGGTVNE